MSVLFQGRYYQLRNESISWQSAVNFANSLKFKGVAGHLVTITSQSEQLYTTGLSGGASTWIGVSDIGMQGLYLYSGGSVDGQRPSYTAWGSGQPSNTAGNDCAELVSNGMSWSNINCATHVQFIVEFECPPGFVFTSLACQSKRSDPMTD